MLKNKSKIIALLTLIVLAFTIGIVNADNEEPVAVSSETSTSIENPDTNQAVDPHATEPISEGGENTEATPAENNMKSSDAYLIGDTVTVDYIVDGNAFIFADTVIIDSQIGGNLFVCAKEVTIKENGFIVNSLFGFAEKMTISGVVCDLYAAAKEVNVSGYIYRDMRVGAETLNLNGIVGRDAFVEANNISFTSTDEEGNVTSNAMISNNFNYTSDEEISIPENVVRGKVEFNKSTPYTDTKSISDYILNLGTFVCTVVAIWLLALWLTPKFVKNPYNILSKKVLPAIGYGILTPIVLIFAFVVLLVLGITAGVSLIALMLLAALIAISSSSFVITANGLVCSKLKMEKTAQSFGMLIVCAVAYWLIALIPVVGTLFSLVAGIIGLGIVVYNILPFKAKDDKTEVIEPKSKEAK